MNAMNFKHLVIIPLLLLANSAHSETQNVSIAEMENAGSNSNIQIESSLSLGGGTTTNAARLLNETPGTYTTVSPSFSLEHSPSDSLAINAELNVDLKQFSDEKAKNLANEMMGEARGAFIWFASEFWEIGGDIGATYAENRLPVQISSTETTAQAQKYLEPDSRFYAAWISDKMTFESGVSAKKRNYWTTMEDRGNIFHNDYEQVGADFKASYTFHKDFKLSLRSLIENKQYKEKAADFSDGAASSAASPNPTLQETSTEYNIIADYTLGKIKLSTMPGIRLNKDRIFGAKDSQTLKLQQKMIISLSNNLSWSPTVSYTREDFNKFRSNPEGDPTHSPLREDSDIKFSSPLKYSLRKDTILSFDYGFSKKESNYANNSYSETTISTALAISM